MQRRHAFALSLAVSSALALFGAAPAAFAAAALGQPAPDFSLKDTAGKTVRLADFRGRYVVLEWTNPGCPFVQKHYNSGNIPATQKDATARGVAWLSINSTETASGDYLEPARLAAWYQARQSAQTAVLMDEEGTVGHAYGARTTPHLYIVNPQGVLVYAGGIDSIASARVDDLKTATNYVRQGLDEALAGKAISQAATRPYGCSIKYKS
ncbi:thioredoxin family protein [Variovorax terrae]|uniref:Thioredoxin family protein n=1 Tax=Variovorax terrae TaxID=2923278 RepID=A0A9X1VPW9_9BURK|nr:thioredoxin family protein [Variovorax terrae]MCJ0761641.1 thioredoxin family protein [Variovorax terrae]